MRIAKIASMETAIIACGFHFFKEPRFSLFINPNPESTGAIALEMSPTGFNACTATLWFSFNGQLPVPLTLDAHTFTL